MEITTSALTEIIAEWTACKQHQAESAAAEIMQMFSWQDISEAPEGVYVDILSNGVVRFTNCLYLPEKEAWCTLIRWFDSEGKVQTVVNKVLNPTHFMIPPRLR